MGALDVGAPVDCLDVLGDLLPFLCRRMPAAQRTPCTAAGIVSTSGRRDRAADAAVVHFEDLLLGPDHQEGFVDPFLHKLVLDDGDARPPATTFLDACLVQDEIE